MWVIKPKEIFTINTKEPFLIYLIINWGWQVGDLTQDGLFAACNKLEQILNHGQADTMLFSMFGHIKIAEEEVSLSDEMARHIAWNGVVEYYMKSGLRDRHPEGLEQAIEKAEEKVHYEPISETALVKLEDGYLVRQGPKQTSAINNIIKRTRERIFGEAEDDEYYPPQFLPDLLSLRYELGLRASMTKEESVKLLRRSKRQLAARFQENTDRREQKRLKETIDVISRLIKEENQRPDMPQPRFVPSRYPLVKVTSQETPKDATIADAVGKREVVDVVTQLKQELNIPRLFAIVVGADKEERAEFTEKLSGCGFDGVAEGASANEARQSLVVEYGLNADDFILILNIDENNLSGILRDLELKAQPLEIDENIYHSIKQYLLYVKTQA